MDRILGIIALTALAMSGCTTADRSPEAGRTTNPPAAKVLTITGLPQGDAPKIAWAKGTLLNGDPAQDVLPSDVDQFAHTKQLLVIRDIDGNVFAYAPDGPIGSTPIGTATGDIAINRERNLVAWIAPDGSPTALQEGEAGTATLPAQVGVTAGDAVAVLGHDCFNGPETVEGAGCGIMFRSNDSDPPASFSASNHGFVMPLAEDLKLFVVQDSNENGSDVGWTSLNDDQATCSTFIPAMGGAGPLGKSWKTCAHLPLSFSPDGKHLLATGPHGFEGLGASELAILDSATGKPVLGVRNNAKSQAAIVDMTWEDNSHALAVVTQKLTWAIVRVSLDGSVELAGEPLRLTEEADGIPLRLAVQP